MNFNQLKSFYLVATLGTYQAAAERLHATQPAISARIAGLEAALNVKLFDRSGYRVSLTPQGREFLQYAERMLELQSEAVVEISAANQLSGTLRIGTSDTMVASWLPEFLIALRQTHPRIAVELFVRASPYLRDDLVSQNIDIAFLVGSVSNPMVITRDFCECEMGFVAQPENGVREKTMTLADLRGASFLAFEKITLPYQQLRQTLRREGVTANLNAISSLHTVLMLSRKGLGIGHVPLISAQEDIEEGRLARVIMPFEMPSLPFTVSFGDGPHKHLAETVADAARAFVETWQARKFIKIIY